MAQRTGRRNRILALIAATLTAIGGTVALGVSSQAAATTLCNSQTAPASGGAYTIQNNEWGSSAAECITTDGNADFTVANSSIANATNGAPGGYPSIYKGCHWGACTSSSGMPVQAGSVTRAGTVTTSWSTSQPGGSSAYDVAYDIWYNQTPTTAGQPNGAELMVWLNHNGSVQPFGSQVASNVSVGGHTYNVWFGNQGWNTISYTMTSGATSVSNLDVGALTADAISRGYIQTSWYLIDVEAGFELWQGGAGLAANSFSVNVNGGGGGANTVTVTSPGNQTGTVGTATSAQVRATDSAAGQTLTYGASGLPPGLSINSSSGLISGTPATAGTYNVTATARDTTGAAGSAGFTWTIGTSGGGGSGACTAAYSVTSSWQGGFQGQVTVTNGGTPRTSWTVSWTYPGDQKINNMWNATYTQSGASVTARNASYDGALAAGASATFGFTGTFTSSNAAPASLTCS
jgi:hypothetical protein